MIGANPADEFIQRWLINSEIHRPIVGSPFAFWLFVEWLCVGTDKFSVEPWLRCALTVPILYVAHFMHNRVPEPIDAVITQG